MPDCIFCEIADNKINCEILYEDTEITAFKDINPQAPVHVLIIPKRHIDSINEINPEDAGLIGKLVTVAREIASRQEVERDGYRLVFNCGADGGQTVGHLHLHLLGGRKMTWPPG